MKKQLLAYILLVLVAALGACKKDFLERRPLSDIAPQDFFNTEKDLEIYTNSLYGNLPGTDIYSADNTSDNVETAATNEVVAGRHIVKTSAGEAGWNWGALRNINYFLNSYQKAAIPDSVKNHYAGIARFFRALFYLEKVQRFGDVPWYSNPLEANSPELYKARDSRVLVVDSIVSDLDFAAAKIKAGKNVSRITKWAALALKARVCLFEGTYRKYHSELGLGGADELLQKAADAAKAIMDGGMYRLYSTGKPEIDYLNLFAADAANTDEFILARVYDRTLNKTHAANGAFTVSTLGAPGLTKALINSYLMKDGTPFSSVANYTTMPYWEEVKNRDPRLAQTIRTPGYKRIGTSVPLVPDYSDALTGYQGIKFVTGTDQDGFNSNSNDLPIFRYAEVLLIYAEAKAELHQLTQGDADKSVNVIRTRAGMPFLTLAALTADPVLLQHNPGVTDPIILEVRRERRVELAIEGFRYQDLMRWKLGALLAQRFLGAYFPGKGEFDLDGDGKNDVAIVDARPDNPVKGLQYFILKPDRALTEDTKGNIVVHPVDIKKFESPKHYLFPLPLTEMLLNKNLTQNPDWDK